MFTKKFKNSLLPKKRWKCRIYIFLLWFWGKPIILHDFVNYMKYMGSTFNLTWPSRTLSELRRNQTELRPNLRDERRTLTELRCNLTWQLPAFTLSYAAPWLVHLALLVSYAATWLSYVGRTLTEPQHAVSWLSYFLPRLSYSATWLSYASLWLS